MNRKQINSNSGRRNSVRRRGFTLVELLLVLTILAVLASIVIPRMTGRIEQGKETAARVQVEHLGMALSIFEVDNGYLPKGADGLQSLIIKPREARDTWKGPYLEKNKVPLDPWKRPYVYQNPGRHNPAGYDLYSNGKDGQGGTNIIGNWIPD
jgi:general secretion pathway protein G